MASWRHEAALVAVLVAGCSVGEGQGAITVNVQAPECDLDEAAYELEPSFFSGEITGVQLNIRIQRGSRIEGYADGLVIHVSDVSEVFSSRIGIPIEVESSTMAFLQTVIYFNETCPSGFPDFFTNQPVMMEGQSGAVIFSAIYAPNIEAGATLIEGRLVDVVYEDAADPVGTHATVNGTFSFFYQRGAPAQRFP